MFVVGDEAEGGAGGKWPRKQAHARHCDVEAMVGMVDSLRDPVVQRTAERCRPEPSPVMTELLDWPVGPAGPLFAIGVERFGDEPPAEGLGEVDGPIAERMHAYGELGVFSQAPLGPTACVVERACADHRHRPDGDPGPMLLERNHPCREEHRVFPVGPS